MRFLSEKININIVRLYSSEVSSFNLSIPGDQKKFNINLINLFKTLFHIRGYSTRSFQFFGDKLLLGRTAAFQPWFVTGFIDAEGCFHVSITKNNKLNVGWKVQLFFEITLSKKDIIILVNIKSYLGIGKIYKKGSTSVKYIVTSEMELELLIKFFDSYPLITHKLADYTLLKRIFNLMQHDLHLTMRGLRKIVALKAKMNRGLSNVLTFTFTNVQPIAWPLVKSQSSLDPNWVAGFASGEGCFAVIIQASSKYEIGYRVQLKFTITQHIKDEQLLKSFIIYLYCGRLEKVKSRPNIVEFIVTKLDDISQKIIPFLKKHPILGVKALDFADWCKVAEMMKEKKHLTKEGLEQIWKIKARMNTGRKFY